MTRAPLVGANGQPLDPVQKDAPVELVRPQRAPLPALAGVQLVRIREARNSQPEAWRIVLLLQVGLRDGKGFKLDLPKGLKGRELALGLRKVAAHLDKLVDDSEAAPANDDNPAVQPPAQAQPNPETAPDTLGSTFG